MVRTLVAVLLLSVILTQAGVHAEDGETDRQKRFINFLQEHPLREFTTPGGYDSAYMGRLVQREFGGRIAELVPAALDHESSDVWGGAILAMGGSLDPDVFGLLVDIFTEEIKFVGAERGLKSHLSQRAIEYFFDNRPTSDYMDEEMADRLGRYCMNKLPKYMRFLGRMKYRPAESALVSYVKKDIEEGEVRYIHAALRALNEMASPQYDELVLSEETREVMRLGGRDYIWFYLLIETMDSSERVRDGVREIVLSDDIGRTKMYWIRPDAVMRAALDIGDDECLDVVWRWVKSDDQDLRSAAVYMLMSRPRSYIRTPEEEQAMLDAANKVDGFHDRVRAADPGRLKEGTIRHWLLDPDSPLRPLDPDEEDR